MPEPTKVYVVTAFSAEPYEDSEWTDSVWSTMEKADAYVKSKRGVQFSYPKDDYGYIISTTIKEYEVQ